MASLYRGTSPLITADTRVYLRDCYDHTVQLIDLLEVYRELATSLMELYMTSVSNRMNEIMKVLTIISTIFIPLTFIAGVYGMNFNTLASKWNMPELDWAFGYPMVLGLMTIIAACMMIYFWRKGWLNGTAVKPPREDVEDDR
jgi:magnesium transporter